MRAIQSNSKLTEGNSLKDYLSFFYVFLVLVCFYPYEFYSAYPFLAVSRQQVVFMLLFGFTIVLTIVFRRQTKQLTYSLFIVLAMQCFWMLLNNMSKGKSIGSGVFMTPLLAISLVIFINATCGLKSFFKKYNFWILLMTSMGTLAWFLVRAGLLGSLYPFTDLSDDDIMYNYLITFSQDYGFAYCGFFDEPGSIASWSMFALLFNKLFIKNNKIEIGLIVTTLLTFSLGYYVQLLVYILLFHVFGLMEKKGRYYSLFLILILVTSVYIGFTTQETNDSEVYDKTIGRLITAFEESKEQGLAVDDRENSTINARREFMENPLLGTNKENITIGNNIYEPLAMYGIIGTFFLYFPFIVLLIRALKKRDNELLRCMLVIFVGFTHRPFHSNLLSFFIVYSMLIMCSNKELLKNYNVSRIRTP